MYDTLFVDLGEPGSRGAAHPHVAGADPGDADAAAADLHRSCPAACSAATPPTPRTCRCSTRSRGWSIDRGITFADLAGTIEAFTKAFFGARLHVAAAAVATSRSPSRRPSSTSSAPTASWLELGGCGMVHPNVLRNCGLDPEEWSGFAFGFGIDRMATERHGIDDLREMFTNDIRFLEQF